jgi:asparagine synthetase B (glutamine-hydrolysing)
MMDERPLAGLVARHLGMPLRTIPLDLGICALPAFPTDDPCTPPQWTGWSQVFEKAAGEGIAVMLTGDGGDDLMTGRLNTILVDAARGDWREVYLRLEDWSRSEASLLRLLKRNVLHPLVPAAAMAALGRGTTPVCDWVPDAANDGGDLVPAALRREFDPNALWSFSYPVMGPSTWLEKHLGAASGIATRDPFWDVRLVEAVMAIPERVAHPPGRAKAVLRRYLEPRVPCEISERLTKPAWTAILARMLKNLTASHRLREAPRLVSLGVVNADALAAAWAAFAGGRSDQTLPLWRTLTCEHWLRSLETCGVHPSALPQAGVNLP